MAVSEIEGKVNPINVKSCISTAWNKFMFFLHAGNSFAPLPNVPMLIELQCPEINTLRQAIKCRRWCWAMKSTLRRSSRIAIPLVRAIYDATRSNRQTRDGKVKGWIWREMLTWAVMSSSQINSHVGRTQQEGSLKQRLRQQQQHNIRIQSRKTSNPILIDIIIMIAGSNSRRRLIKDLCKLLHNILLHIQLKRQLFELISSNQQAHLHQVVLIQPES